MVRCMGPTNWNYADLLEAVAGAVPDWPAQIHDGTEFTWADFSARANGLAADLLNAGLSEQSKVAAYLYNGPEYLETYFAAFKAGLVPVNTNYRYGRDEITYLFANADAEAVVFDATFLSLIERVRHELPGVRRWYMVGNGATGRPDWACDYESVVSAGTNANVAAPWGRNGDQLLLLYTGGTTGMPKGVMWRQDDLFNVLGVGGNAVLGVAALTSTPEAASRLITLKQAGLTGGPRLLPACPLMHGTGQFSSLIALMLGGAVVTIPNRTYDPAYLFDVIERDHVTTCVIVGDAFAKPMLTTLQEHPGRWTLPTLSGITSSGVMWSQETKAGLLELLPHVTLVDSYGSSEAVGLGQSVSTKDGTQQTAKFSLGPTVHVFSDDDRRIEAGSDETGFVAISGFVPLGYYKDEAKTAKTFRVIDGVRYSIPGDFANVNPDGTLHLLGRGSVCINTGGEKVFPEEVEEVLKQHPGVDDAVCVGVPDERFGEVIVAMVQAAPSAEHSDAAALIEHVRDRLARYKSPRHILYVETIGRSPAGKVDYQRLKHEAVTRLTPSS
jgi:3-oxocholest-4-en-26-oate---CoA ligase